MKILLIGINAKYIHSNPAIRCLKAYAGEYSEYVELAEYTINQQTEDVLMDIYGKKPDAVAFSCYIWNIDFVGRLISDIHSIMPQAQIWLGGPEVSYSPSEALEKYGAQIVFAGQGEQVFAAAVRELVQSGETVRNRGVISAGNTSLSSVPFIYSDMKDFSNRIVYYESSRGCPFACSYCLSSIDKSMSFRDMELVKRELDFFLDNKTRQVKFIDRTFNCSKQHAMEVWQHILEHDNGITNFHFEIEAGLIDEDMLALLEKFRPGAVQLEIGVQTTNSRALEAVNRKNDFDRIAAVVSSIRSYGNIHQHLDLIAGLPYEDYESFGNSFDDVYALRPEQLQLGFLKILDGSDIKRKADEYNIRYMTYPPYEVLGTKWLGFNEICRLKGIEAVLEMYYNSGQFPHSLLYLEKSSADAFGMYEALSDFFHKKDLFGLQESRIRKYDILYEFALETMGSMQEVSIFVQYLTLDYYLRENSRVRPYWAKAVSQCDIDADKDIIAKEASIHKILEGYDECSYRDLCRLVHIEHFELIPEKGIMIFDYRHRNPLTGNAKLIAYDDVSVKSRN